MIWSAVSCLLLICVTHSLPIDPVGTGGTLDVLESNQIKQDDGEGHVLVGSHSQSQIALPSTGNMGMPIVQPTDFKLDGLVAKGKNSMEDLESNEASKEFVKNQNFGQVPQVNNQEAVANLISNVNQKLITNGPSQPQYYPQAGRIDLGAERILASNVQLQQGGSQSQQGQIGLHGQIYSQQLQQSPQGSAAETQLGEIQQPQYGLIQPTQVGQWPQPQYNTGQQNQFGLTQQPQYMPAQQNQLDQRVDSPYNSGQQNQYDGLVEQGYMAGQPQQNSEGEKSQFNPVQQNQYVQGGGQLQPIQAGQNQFGLSGYKPQPLSNLNQHNQQARSDQYPDSRERQAAMGQLHYTDGEKTGADAEEDEEEGEEFYKDQTQEPFLSEDRDEVSNEQQGVERRGNIQALPPRPTVLPEQDHNTGKTDSKGSQLAELYDKRDEEDVEDDDEEEYEEDQIELEAERRAMLEKSKETQDVSSLYDQSSYEGKLHGDSKSFSHPTDSTGVTSAGMQHERQDPEEQENEEDDWYDDPNSYGEGDKSYSYQNQKEEEDVEDGDHNVEVSDNDEYDKNQQDYQGEGDDGFDEDVVDSAMVKKDKQPTAPSSMVLFYTWTIVAILIMVVSVSTYQTRCKGLRSHIPKLTHSDDRKRLLEHEYT